MFKNYSVLIVDDEPLIAETIKDYLLEFGLMNIELRHSKSEALKRIGEHAFDLVLLDIRMKGYFDGIEIGESLSNTQIPFIYVTAHSDMEMAKKMLGTNAKSYISKPIRKEELFMNVGFVLNDNNRKTINLVNITNGNEIIRLSKEEINYIKSVGNYLEIYQKEKKSIIRNTFEGFLKEIDDPDFIQTHRSFIINSKKIQKFNAKEVSLFGNILIPISRTFSNHLRTNLSQK